MRHTLCIMLLCVTLAALADDKSRQMTVHNTDGTTTIITLTNVDSITFATAEGGNVSATDARQWYVNIENPSVCRYMNEVDYTDLSTDYTITAVKTYANTPSNYIKHYPRGARITWASNVSPQQITLKCDSTTETISIPEGSAEYTLTNLMPGKRYEYSLLADGTTVEKGHFYTVGQVRMLYLPSMRNMRDLGGWTTFDGKRLRYGRLFRGGEMNNYYNIAEGDTHCISPEDSAYLHDVLKIRLELDLRDDRDLNLKDTDPSNDRNHTELGSDVEYVNLMPNYNHANFIYYHRDCAYRWGDALRTVIKGLTEGKNIYFHCVWGADRTGTLAMLIQGLCGVSQSDIEKEFELTAFYRDKNRTWDYWGENLEYIKTLNGNTLKEKFETYCKRVGLTETDIEQLRNELLE